MISIVIPAYDEEKALPSTLDDLFQQHEDDATRNMEVIVVDGGSRDRTRHIAEMHPDVRLLHAPKGRASQMNAGARASIGEWLLFLHADTRLPPNALARIHAFDNDTRVLAGGFRHRFSGHDWRLRLISYLDNRRCDRSRIIYGDQAMFVRRAIFEQLGGFPAQPVLEDVAFCEKLVTVTRPVLLEECVLTDSRKFVQMGIWRSLARVALIMTRAELGRPVSASHPFFQDVR